MYKRSELFDANFVYFVLIALFVVIRILTSIFNVSTVAGYLLNGFIQIGLMLGLPLFVFSALRKQKVKMTMKSFGFNKISGKAVMYSILIGILVYGLTICVSSFFSLILHLFGYDPTYGGSSGMTSFPVYLLFIELLSTAILPGICEEVAHRGMLVSAYKPLGMKKTILLSGLLFGLMHLNIEQFFYATLIGFLFGFIAIITDSIFPTMIMHFVNNALSVYISFASVNKLPLGNVVSNAFAWLEGFGLFGAFFVILFVVTIMVSLLAWLVFKLFKETSMQRIKRVADDVVKQQLRQKLFEGTSMENTPSLQEGVSVEQRESIGQRMIYDVKITNLLLQKKYKPKFKEKIFMYSTLFLGVILTIFTFVWGII